MTESGEVLTLKGEFNQEQDNVFSFHKAMAISYSIDSGNRNQVEVKMAYPTISKSPLFQMIFVMKGKIAFSEKITGMENGQIESQQHNLCCISPKSTRMLLGNPKDEIVCINLSSAILSKYLPENHPVWLQLNEKQGSKNSIMLSPLNMHITPEISAILQRLEQTSHGGFCDQLMLESKVIELLALQIFQFEKFQTAAHPLPLKKEELERMHQVKDILIQHTGEQLSLRTLAHRVGTNEFTLKRNFKIAYGTTVYGYFNQYKMEQAKNLLVEKGLSIAEVSLKMGYKYATHFSSAFKKYYGYLPNKLKSGKLSLLIFIEDFYMFIDEFGMMLGY